MKNRNVQKKHVRLILLFPFGKVVRKGEWDLGL